VDEYLPLTWVRDGMADTSPLSELTDTSRWLQEVVQANRFVSADLAVPAHP